MWCHWNIFSICLIVASSNLKSTWKYLRFLTVKKSRIASRHSMSNVMADLTKSAYITIYRMLNDRDRRVFSIYFAMEVCRIIVNFCWCKKWILLRLNRSIVVKPNNLTRIFHRVNENSLSHQHGLLHYYKNGPLGHRMSIVFCPIKSRSIGWPMRRFKIFK